MIIREIHIDGFGKLRGLTLPLKEGFQVLAASNEQGKTTLLRFVQALFYGLGKRSATRPLASRERYQPWLGEEWGGYILFTHQGRSLRLERRFGSSQSYDVLKLYNAQTGEELPAPWSSREEPGQYYFEMAEADFALAAFVTQPQGGMGFHPSADGLVDQLRTLVGDLEEGSSYTEVQQRLKRAQEQIRSKSGKAGLLPDLTQRLETLQQDLHTQRQLRERVDEQLAEVQVWQNQQQHEEQQAHALQNRLDQARRWAIQATTLQRLEEQVQRIRDLARRREELDRQFENRHTNPAAAQNLLDEFLERATAHQELQRQDEEWKTRSEQLKQAHEEWLNTQRTHKFLPDAEGVFPWDAYAKRFGEKQAILQRETPWLELREEEIKLREARAAVSRAQQVCQEQEAQLQAACQAEEEAERVLEPLKIALRREESLCLSQEAVCRREEEWMVRRQQERDEAMAERNATYLRGLRNLLILTAVFLPLACILGLVAALVPLALPWRQLLTVLAIGSATVGLGAAIRRNAFPPARPTRIVETDANANLLYEQQILQQYQENQQAAVHRVQEAQAHLEETLRLRIQAEARLEQQNQTLEACCAHQEDQSAEVARREREMGEPISEAGIAEHCNRAETAEITWKSWQQMFLEERGLENEEAYPAWEAEGRLSWIQRTKVEEVQAEHQNIREVWRAACVSYEESCQKRFASWFREGDLPASGSQWSSWLQEQASELSTLIQKRTLLQEEWQEAIPVLQGQTLYHKEEELNCLRAQRTQELQALHAPLTSLQEWKEQGEAWENWLQDLESRAHEQFQNSRQIEERALQQLYQAQAAAQQLTPLHQLERQIEQNQSALEEADQRYRALEYARDWLNQAEEELQNELAPQLNQGTGAYLKELTCNRYDRATVHRNLDVHVDASESIRSKPSGVFSAGTFDQVYLALRLALTDLLRRSEELPLFCDDPFVNYDPERMLAAYRLLARLGRKGRQILLVTCHPAPNGLRPQEEGISWQVWEPEAQTRKG